MDTLVAIVREEVKKYAGTGRGSNTLMFPLLDDEHNTYSVVGVNYPSREYKALIAVFARIRDDRVIIEEDNTDKPLLDALIQRGVARDKIILAYAGDPIPDAETYRL